MATHTHCLQVSDANEIAIRFIDTGVHNSLAGTQAIAHKTVKQLIRRLTRVRLKQQRREKAIEARRAAFLARGIMPTEEELTDGVPGVFDPDEDMLDADFGTVHGDDAEQQLYAGLGNDSDDSEEEEAARRRADGSNKDASQDVSRLRAWQVFLQDDAKGSLAKRVRSLEFEGNACQTGSESEPQAVRLALASYAGTSSRRCTRSAATCRQCLWGVSSYPKPDSELEH
jgi:hypothetical protein